MLLGDPDPVVLDRPVVHILHGLGLDITFKHVVKKGFVDSYSRIMVSHRYAIAKSDFTLNLDECVIRFLRPHTDRWFKTSNPQ